MTDDATALRILILGNARSPHTQRWAQGLAEAGCEVQLLSIRHDAVPGVSLRTFSVGPRNSPSRLWTTFSYLRLLLAAPALFRRLRPDVVNAHFSVTHGLIAAVGRMRPLVISTWGRDVIGPAGELRGWRAVLNRWILPHAQSVTVISRFMEEPVQRFAGSTPVVRIPWGIDTAVFTPVPDQNVEGSLRPITIGFVKSLGPKYGPEYLIRAFALVQQKLPDSELVLAGEGPLVDELQALVNDLSLSSYVRFLGRVPHNRVPALIGSFDILVNPSVEESETFGVVILEASACQVPVVATSVGGVTETVLDGETGILVPERDVESLAAALIKLGLDPNLRLSLGRAGRRFVQDEYEWHRCVETMSGLLQRTAADFGMNLGKER